MRSRLVLSTLLLLTLLVAAACPGMAQEIDPSTPGVSPLLEANKESLAIDSLPEAEALTVASSPEPQTGIVSPPDDVPIHYSTYGTGSPALVFVHGISCDQTYWRKQVGPFSKNLQVVTIDLAGHGESGLGRTEWSMEAYGGDVAAVIGSLDLQNVILIGHSMGGVVILEAARQLPGRVDGIVIVDAFESFDTWWTPEEIEEVLNPLREDFVEQTRAWVRGMFTEESDPAFIEEILTDMSSAPPEVALASLQSAITKMYGRERTTALTGLGAPVFIINADYSPSDVDSLAGHGAEVHIIPGTGHFFMLEEAPVFNSVLSSVVQRLLESDLPVGD
jgi:pimeloyl-ACP methyl ester carboxylesterase